MQMFVTHYTGLHKTRNLYIVSVLHLSQLGVIAWYFWDPNGSRLLKITRYPFNQMGIYWNAYINVTSFGTHRLKANPYKGPNTHNADPTPINSIYGSKQHKIKHSPYGFLQRRCAHINCKWINLDLYGVWDFQMSLWSLVLVGFYQYIVSKMQHDIDIDAHLCDPHTWNGQGQHITNACTSECLNWTIGPNLLPYCLTNISDHSTRQDWLMYRPSQILLTDKGSTINDLGGGRGKFENEFIFSSW